MPLLSFVLTLVVIGIGLVFVNKAPWIDGRIKQIINFVVIGSVIVWTLFVVGILGQGRASAVRVPTVQSCSVLHVGMR